MNIGKLLVALLFVFAGSSVLAFDKVKQGSGLTMLKTDDVARVSQGELADLFVATCLKGFPKPAPVFALAKKRGFQKFSEHQWSKHNTLVNVVASQKGRKAFCIASARGTSPENLGRVLVPKLRGVKDAKVRIKANGRATEIRGVANGIRVWIETRPNGQTRKMWASAEIIIRTR